MILFWRKKTPSPEDTSPPGSPPETEPDKLPENIIPFPGELGDEIVDELRQRVEQYSRHLYAGEEEDTSESPESTLLPNTDEEEESVQNPSRRKHIEEDAPDIPPLQLAKKYGAGLSFLRLRIYFILILACITLYPVLAASLPLPMPSLTQAQWRLEVWVCGGLLAAGMLLAGDVLLKGIVTLGAGFVMTLACAASAADALTMPVMGDRGQGLPFCAVNLFALAALLWGEYLKKRGRRTACRAAVTVRNPDYVSLDENSWSGQDAYARWMGSGLGYGSQIQGLDGTQRILRIAVPLLTIACVLFSSLASLGQDRPELLLWCLSATLTAAASFSAAIAYAAPFDRLATRLSKSGTALCGWAGICTTGRNLLITDRDLFPLKAVHIVDFQLFNSFSEREVMASTATLVREGGLGLARVFHTAMRQLDLDYYWIDELIHQEGGITAILAGVETSIGTGAFMRRTEVSLPVGIDDTGKLFCAIDGRLAGIFTLDYQMSTQSLRAVRTLLKHRITPILITRDFGISMKFLRDKFKLPTDKMIFPAVPHRVALSDPGVPHDPAITAVLYREGLDSFAEAVVAAKRLRSAAVLGTWLSIAGSVVGVLMSYYLTFMEAYSALSPMNLLIFMVCWLIPVVLIGRMADMY
ncbi:MAG: hypothetical protein H6Q60_1063 [Oscillospiraceae bacterium]|nr:hypothetical protein [Oscillospiraceae bacterium]